MSRPLKTFRIGGELEIDRLGYGAMKLTKKGMTGEPDDPEAMKDVLRRVVELGINFIDTADSYGPYVSERLIGEALAPYPEDLHIATKVGLLNKGTAENHDIGLDASPEHIRESIEGSLERLKLECIDLYQLHRIDPETPVEESIGTFKELQGEGKIKHIGLSEVSVAEIKQVQAMTEVATVQNQYNLSDRKHEAVLEYCEEQNIGFIPWFPLATGELATSENSDLAQIAEYHSASSSQIALAWLLHKSPVILPIPGTSSLEHLEENVAARDIELTSENMEVLEEISHERTHA